MVRFSQCWTCKTRLFRKGTYLAVLAEGEGFWICWTKTDVFLENDTFSVVWLEKLDGIPSNDSYTRMEERAKIDLRSVITKVTMIREKESRSGKPLYRLPEKEKLKIENILKQLKEGFKLNAYEKENFNEKTSEVLLMEMDGQVTNRKRKFMEENPKRGQTKGTKKEKAGNDKNGTKKEKVNKAKKLKKTKERKEKKKVDRTDPNRRLKPNPNVKVWTKDPLFEMKEKVPFVSGLAHSKLAIRAVLTDDMKLLEQCKDNGMEIYSLFVKRSLGNEMTALRYALKTKNLAAVEILYKPSTAKTRIGLPNCLLPTQGTGTYNYRTLGIKKVRRLNMSRGAREGNNAFTKDQQADLVDTSLNEADVMHWNLPIKFINDLLLMSEKSSVTSLEGLMDEICEAVRYGHRELAAHFIEKDLKQGGSSFSKFYKEALLGEKDPWKETVREVSARKTSGYENRQITPLHCACINPSTGPLEALFKVCPDLYIADKEEKKLVHYAAACEDIGPLKFLVDKGANLEDPDIEGQTPLMIACKVGRPKSADFIIEKLSERSTDEDSFKKFGKGGIDKPGKDTWCPLHIAVAEQNHEVAKVLLKHGAKADKPLSTRYDKITSLMLAAANGDLDMIKILIGNKAKIEKHDRYKRTALTHAVINGSSSVASYLLSLGADPNKLDSSQNSNLHYACAYGWWFCMKVLIEAGATIDAENEWSLTPLGVSVMKGNKGIVDHLVKMPGIDINMKNDKGRTILLNMLVDQNDFTDELLTDIKDLVDNCGADPKVKDNQGKHALHYIAESRHGDSEKRNEQLKIIHQSAEFFMEKGLSTLDEDKDGNIPLVHALKNQFSCEDYKEYKTGNIQMMGLFLKDMQSKWKEVDILTAKEMVEKVMIQFVTSISLLKVSQYLEIFLKIGDFINVLKHNGVLKNLDFLDEIRTESGYSLTIFATLCEHYSIQKFHDRGYGEKVPEDVQRKCWDDLSRLVELFIIDYKPKMEIEFVPEDNIQKPRYFHALIHFSRVDQDKYKAFKMILKYSKNVDVMDSEENTPLMMMIDKHEIEHVKSLLQAGAMINRLRIFKGDQKELPIERAMHTRSMEMLRFLLENGAIAHTQPLTGSSLLHTAVEACGKNKTKHNLEFVKLFLEYGCNVNEKSIGSITPLHIAVNSSRDASNVSLDLETLLIRNRADVNALDSKLRTPLHYAFLKIEHPEDISACDPIQIVSSLVEAMDINKIQQKDIFGSTALHYAALRGATVCSLLLIQIGSEINILDNNKNSPLANAVVGRHDSCALMLLQKDADINVMIHKSEQPKDHRKTAKDKLWKFLPEHWPTTVVEQKPITLFEGIVTNDWLGITYLVLGKLEKFGMSYARTVEVALRLQKLQFAKTLISRQVVDSKLQEIITDGRNLMNCMAFEINSRNIDIELVHDVFALFDDAGVDADITDKFGCSPLHYAALKNDHNIARLLLAKEGVKKNINSEDNLGRTPFATYFWNYETLNSSIEDTLPHLLIENGADPNIIFNSKPLSMLDDGYNPRFFDSEYNNPKAIGSPIGVSPLIIAIVHRDQNMVQYLLKNGAKVTVPDSLGRSPAMYAMKTNNQTIIDEILKHESEINMDCLDDFDHGIIDHTLALDPADIETPTYDNAETVTKILKTDIDLNAFSKTGLKSPTALAKRLAANKSNKVLCAAMKQKFQGSFNFPSEIKANEIKMSHDHRTDSKTMMKLKEEELEREMKDKDENDRDTQEGCTVRDGTIYQDYEIFMLKVDVGFGSHGLYNFYRIQIWKEEHKELYVLFTNWGRIDRYSNGQYQNTPFSKPEDAIKEFCKIFKAKSGNEWNDRGKFVNKPKKYRLVKAEHVSRVVRPTFEMDLLTYKKSQLPVSTQCFLKDITDVKMIKSAYNTDAKIDKSSVPFERIKEEAIREADKLLDELLPLIKQREKLDVQKYDVEGEKQKEVLQKLNDILDKVCRLSSEYYFIVPKDGYEYEKILPVDRTDSFEKEKKRLEYLLEFETSKSLILGAMLRKKEIHPLDYIFSSLKCKIELMNEQCQEAQYIMKYMYRSDGAKQKRVEGIFKVQRLEEKNRFNQATKPKNRKLLWHGTKMANMISILSKGLVVNAPYAQITGRSFGDGIYFADIFDKSCSYSSDQYMLLCDVDLGDCQVVEDTDYNDCDKTIKYDSLFVRGQNVPDEKMTLKTKGGYYIPVGKIVPKKADQERSWNWNRQDYSEYVVHSAESIVIRYIVKIGNGMKEYTQEDLFMKMQEEMEVDGVVSNGLVEEDETNGTNNE